MRAKEMVAVSKRPRRLVFRVGLAIIAGTLIVALPCAAEQLANDKLSLTVNAQDGSYELGVRGAQPVLNAREEHRLTTSGCDRAIIRGAKRRSLDSTMSSDPAAK